MIITFIYTVPCCERVFYGKYVGYVIDTYEDGLDMELNRIIMPILQKYYKLKDDASIIVGILSHYRKESSDYFSENEKHALTMLYCKWPAQAPEIFMNGMPFALSSPQKNVNLL